MTLSLSTRLTLSWLALALAAVGLLWLLGPVLTPFIVGAVLAYALHPAVEALVRRRVPRLLAVMVVEVVALIAALAVLLLIVPIISKELPLLKAQLPTLLDRLDANLSPWLAQHGINVSLDLPSLRDWLKRVLGENLEDWSTAVLNSARIGGSFLLTLVGNAVLVPVVLFYLLIDWPNLVERAHRLVPPRMRDSVDGFLDEADTLLGQYLRGQLLVMLVLAAYYSIGLALFGFDLAMPVGVFTGLAIFIPYLGFGLGLVLALVAGVLQFGSWFALVAVAVVYGIGQVVESLYLTPRLVGERIGLNPLAVIFVLLAFGQLLGFIGVLVALPLSAVGLVGLRRLLVLYRSSRLYTG